VSLDLAPCVYPLFSIVLGVSFRCFAGLMPASFMQVTTVLDYLQHNFRPALQVLVGPPLACSSR
jgi:hypothetical protein